MKKRIATLLMVVTLASLMSTTVFAWDTERFLEEPTINEKGYVVGWSWQDGNKDGVYECYYSDDNGMRLSNTTTPDGYEVNNRGQWVVNGVIQTRTRKKEQTAINYAAYDPAHPLAGMVDAWNLRLVRTNYENGTMGTTNLISNWNVQAMLTNQMDMYRNDLGIDQSIEQILYNWYCNWLNSMDFRNMSEYQRAQEVRKIITAAEYEVGTGTESTYAVLINKKGQCTDFAMTAKALSTALGLKCDVKGNGDHSWYYIYADGNRYVGSNNGIDLVNTISDEAFHSGYYDYDQRNDFYNRLNDFYNNQ